jgi:2-C-methyl-D-erythritol 4-phosphate cytidylyltransferase
VRGSLSKRMAIALIVAAGRGERLAADRPKALVELAGRPMVQWSIDVLAAMAEIEQIVVALPPGADVPSGVTGVAGGSSRSDSVRRALAAAGGGDPVLVHDAARPLLTAEIARTTLAALEQNTDASAAIAAAPVTDTIKRVDDRGGVHETLERGRLWAVQTPQVFRRDVLERALDVSPDVLAAATDDAWLIERLGERVVVADVKAENMKVTRPLDLEIAARLLARRPPASA